MRERVLGRTTRWLVPKKVREVMRILEANGWSHVRTRGSHRIYKDRRGATTVLSGKLSEEVPAGTLREIMKQTGIEELR